MGVPSRPGTASAGAALSASPPQRVRPVPQTTSGLTGTASASAAASPPEGGGLAQASASSSRHQSQRFDDYMAGVQERRAAARARRARQLEHMATALEVHFSNPASHEREVQPPNPALVEAH